MTHTHNLKFHPDWQFSPEIFHLEFSIRQHQLETSRATVKTNFSFRFLVREKGSRLEEDQCPEINAFFMVPVYFIHSCVHSVIAPAMHMASRGKVVGLLLLGIALITTGCNRTDVPNLLDAQGPGAAQISRLWWLMFWLGLAVLLLVMALIAYALFRRRFRQPPILRDERHGERLIVYGGIVLPVPILAIVLGYTIFSGNIVTQPGFLRLHDPSSYVSIEVIGHQFWWEVRYPDHGVLTANEIHIPAGQPVHIQLTSSDVIHSFWVPQLHGKLDLIPGEVNSLWLEADEVGAYRGICAEFCGIQHAHMHFLVVAQPPDEFEAWLAHQQQPAAEPSDPLIRQGQQVFMGAACVYCHTVDGLNEVPPAGTLGPDLTHIASRQTLAAGTLENNRGNLGSWIIDPQSIKPGNRMPPTRLNSDDFHALLAYLESLR